MTGRILKHHKKHGWRVTFLAKGSEKMCITEGITNRHRFDSGVCQTETPQSSLRRQSSMTSSIATPIQNINKNFLYLIGLWPHQTGIEKYTFLSLLLFFITSQSYLQIGGMVAAWEDKDVFLESIPPVLVDFVCGAKVINFIGNAKKMKKLLVILENDWKKFKGRHEIEIMEKYAMIGRRLTIGYAGCMYGSMMPFLIIPAVPIVLDIFGSSNETHVKILMFRVDFLLDAEKYYYPLLLHSYFGTLAFITLVVAIDTMIMTYCQHACGCFAVLGFKLGRPWTFYRYQLEHLVDGVKEDVDVYPQKSDDISYRNMVNCVALHNHILQYSCIIESANHISYFFQLGITMICLSFTGFQTVMQMDRPQISVRYAAFTMTQLVILFLQSYPGQMLYDQSERVSNYVINSEWYLTSIRTRKLVGLMSMRSRKPSQLTAGKFYTLNLANFGAVVRTSMSYLTVLTSVK